MTDNEIIKALECCGNIVDSTCKECFYHKTYNASCVVRLMRDALGLINRQKAENEMLTETTRNEISEAKSEAIKEFAERLKKEATSTFYEERKYVDTEDIDNLVKEIAGE